jgi:phosphoribosylformylglycinamidine cyclo-ligase
MWPQDKGGVAEPELRRTLNMGVGMVLVVDAAAVDAALKADPQLFRLGEIVPGDGVQFG